MNMSISIACRYKKNYQLNQRVETYGIEYAKVTDKSEKRMIEDKYMMR